MSAIQRVKDQQREIKTVGLSNVLDFELRKELRAGLEKSGVYSEVLVKYDGRRGHLNVTLRGAYQSRQATAVIHYAEKAGLKVALNLINQGPNQTMYRVTTLDTITKAAPAPAVPKVRQQAGSTLGRAIQKETTAQQVRSVIAINGFNIGSVSLSIAKQIRQMVEAENKPKFQDIEVVDISNSRKVVINVPYDVAQAVKAQVPSFTQGDFTIKSTDGLTILKQSVAGSSPKTWVIA